MFILLKCRLNGIFTSIDFDSFGYFKWCVNHKNVKFYT